MSKTEPIGVRLEPEERAALERAATSDDRSLSAMARVAIIHWLRQSGHMKGGADARKVAADLGVSPSLIYQRKRTRWKKEIEG